MRIHILLFPPTSITTISFFFFLWWWHWKLYIFLTFLLYRLTWIYILLHFCFNIFTFFLTHHSNFLFFQYSLELLHFFLRTCFYFPNLSSDLFSSFCILKLWFHIFRFFYFITFFILLKAFYFFTVLFILSLFFIFQKVSFSNLSSLLLLFLSLLIFFLSLKYLKSFFLFFFLQTFSIFSHPLSS